MLSLTIPPCGHAAATTARRRTTSPGRDVIAASMRNSVGVSIASLPLQDTEWRAGSRTRSVGAVGDDEPAAPGQDLHPGDELEHVERLRQVVVGAGAEAGEPLVDGTEGGEEEDGRGLAGRPQRLAHVAPVGVGQPDVEDHHVEVVVVGEEPQRLAAVVRGDHLVVREAHGVDDHATDRRVVLAESYSGHRRFLRAVGRVTLPASTIVPAHNLNVTR